MGEYYDRQGKPLDMWEWARLFENPEYKIVKQEQVGPYWVSTVWLGLNHAWSGGTPLIFETMAFLRGDVPDIHELDNEQQRYTTEEEALAGHANLVARIASLYPQTVEEVLDGLLT